MSGKDEGDRSSPGGLITDPEVTASLVELVKHCQPIYDPKAPSHKHTSEIWANITRELNIPGLSMHKVKARWRTLRDSYIKKKKTALASGKAPSSWKYMHLMSFLDPYVQVVDPSNIEGVIETEYVDEGQAAVQLIVERNGELVEIDPAQVFELGQTTTTSIPPSRLPVPMAVTPAESSSGSSSKKSRRKRQSTKLLAKAIQFQSQPVKESRDAMDAFFESCSLRAKQLPKSKQGWLQMQVSMLLYAAESNENVPSHGRELCFQPHWTEQSNGDNGNANATVQLEGAENQDWQN